MSRFTNLRALLALPAVLAVALLVGCTHAQPAAELSVDEIVARHLEARGGEERILALRSMRATGTADAGGGRIARVMREIARPGKIRLEFTYQGMTGVYAHDGTSGWQIAPFQGRFEPEPLSPETASAAVDQIDIEGPLLGWRAKGHAVTLVGRTTVAGRETYELRTTLAGGAVRRDFVDAASFLLARTDTARAIRGRMVPLETTFGDYREVGGLRFPFLIESRAQGRPQSLRIEVERIELDPPIDDARFRQPVAEE